MQFNDKVGGDDSKIDIAVQFNDKVGGGDSKVDQQCILWKNLPT